MAGSARFVPRAGLLTNSTATGTKAATVAVVLALAAVLTACTSGPPPVVTAEAVESTVVPPPANELTIGVDDLGPGFNPHALADLGPVNLGVAGLVLPSPFREDAGGALRPDPTLVESAEVTDQQPFTVAYQLRREASWSDGAPIAAEDFAYLAERMKAEPGVANPAGYRLVQQVHSRSGGKSVEVVFSRPYPGWRTLFSNLLPAHLLKDAPGGWTQVLEGGIPVSGGPFAMRSVDADRGLIVLERNDRYWEVPAVLDRLVLRETDAPDLVSSLATGGDQLAVMRADSIAMALLRGNAAGLPVRTVPEPVAAELLLRQGTALADPSVRAAVAAAIDLADLVAVGSGNGPAAQLATGARTLLPSEPGYRPTVPTDPLVGLPAMRGDAAAAAALLTAAGYERAQQPDGTAQWTRDGRRLSLVVAAPAERDEYRTIATRLVRQLAAAGIAAELITPSGDELFAGLASPPPTEEPAPTSTAPGVDGMPHAAPTAPTAPGTPGTPGAGPDPGRAGPAAAAPQGAGDNDAAGATTTAPNNEDGADAQPTEPTADAVDLAVVPRPVSGDPAADLASWYGCPALDGPAGGKGPAQTDTEPTANPAGYCNRALQATMDDLLTGASPVGEALASTEELVWRDLPSIPLYQHAVVMVTGKGLDAIEPGGLLAGLFANAPRWHRTAR